MEESDIDQNKLVKDILKSLPINLTKEEEQKILYPKVEDIAETQTNIIIKNAEEKIQKKISYKAKLVIAGASGLMIGNFFPPLIKPFLVSSVSCGILIPSLVHYDYLSVTKKGNKTIKEIKSVAEKGLTKENVIGVKQKVIDFAKKNTIISSIFVGCFLVGLNRYYCNKN